MADGEGFEPSTPNLGGNFVIIDGKKYSITPLEPNNKSFDTHIDFKDYEIYLSKKYSNKKYARIQYNHARNYQELLINPSKFLTIPSGQRRNIMKAMMCLAKYLGCYEEYKSKLKNYGIKWSNEDTAFKGFLSIFNKKHNTLPEYLKKVWLHLSNDEKILVKFLAVTGLRAGEGINSFNLIISLNSKKKLDDYYNKELNVLEHFKFGDLFLRGTKNTYISFVSQELITEICHCEPINYNALHCRFKRRGFKLRLKELRSFNNTFVRKSDVISELTDILAGRVPKSVFCRHYLAEDMLKFSKQVLMIQEGLMNALFES
ncbi:integrase [Candidatus Bathycorpusculum sp.]|uniref:integrase n=1 Tax=Candidatus Bathycorpusculum sp. TaxID=2994959 RepID=UPI0028376EE0|nr:hypothetical protein [Candidatus Termitimicrobium sp.]MCL2684886.1 hypothetical protein [Candidatus Termitimicrobium sp.]